MQRTPLVQTLGRLAAAVAMLIGLLPLGAGTAAAGVGGAPDCSQPLDGAASFESVNYPDHFIRHRNSLGELTPTTDGLGAVDATFIVRPGLSGTPGAVSFESVNFRGHFLRHENYRLKLSRNDGSDLLRQDASFVVSGEACRVRFESVNLRGHYIRHQNFELWLANDMAGARNLFEQDTTWGWQAPTHTLALEVGRSLQKFDSRALSESCTLVPGPGPAQDFWVGWGQLELTNSDPCHASVLETAVRFDAGPLDQVPNKTINRAVLTYDEAEGQGCFVTEAFGQVSGTRQIPCWRSGSGFSQPKPAGCVGALRIPNVDWINAAPPGLIPYITGPSPAVKRLSTREWDVTEPFSWQNIPGTIPITPGPRSVPGFGFLLVGGPSLNELSGEDSTSCYSWISNVRLHVTLTVQAGGDGPGPIVR